MNNSLFAVSATKNVHFTPGNLQWINTDAGHADVGYWRIAESQYSYLGKYNAITNSPQKGGVLKAGPVDLFGWGQVTPGSMYGSMNYTDYVSSITDNQQLPNDNNWATKFNITGEGAATLYAAADQPYQKPVGDGDYCVLTKDEWQYLFANQYWGYATVSLTPSGTVNGIVVCPNSVDESTAKSYLTGHIQKSSSYTGSSSPRYKDNMISQKTIDENGLLFLPAAGYRLGVIIYNFDTDGGYWSATSSSAENAYYLSFNASLFGSDNADFRGFGRSVRLATVVQ